jgi:signal transduction histidine kinase
MASEMCGMQVKTVSIMSLSLAHELRQPLQSIHTAAENIADHLKTANVGIPQVDAAADVIRRNVVRIDKHIRFLKELGSGKQEEEVFTVGEVVEEILTVFNEFASARNISLEHVKTGSIAVRSNRSTLLAALTNLVLNACQAIEDSGDQAAHKVNVRIARDKGVVKIAVEDDGPGIPEANRARLFRRQTTSKQGGMGIGLIVWREALQMFAGELECEKFSHPTTFLITLPEAA